MTVGIVIIVAIIVVTLCFGFMIPAIRPTAHIISDDEHPPMENVSHVLRLTFQKVNSVYESCCFNWGLLSNVQTVYQTKVT